MRKVDPVKHKEKRLEILAEAEKCFIAKGFRGASISEICAAARISPGHLYHYFASKEDIIAAIAQIRVEGTATALGEMLREADPFAALLQRVTRIVRAVQASAMLLEMLAEAERNPAIEAIIVEQSEAIRSLFANVVRRGQADGKVDAMLDPDIAASILLSVLIDAMKTLTVRNPALDRDKAAVAVELLVTRFLTCQSGARHGSA